MITFVPPNLSEMLSQFKTSIFNGINCCTIGKVINFNQDAKTVDVNIQYYPDGYSKNTFWNGKKNITRINGEEALFYPTLLDCPIVGNCFASPFDKYEQEDEEAGWSGVNCLVFFCDKNIDNWFMTDQKKTPRNKRKHSLSDGFVIFGIDNLVNNMYKEPEGYEPPNIRDEPLLDAPLPKYGYQNNYARLKYENGEVNVGYDGVIVIGRDMEPIKFYAEGGSIYNYPTEGYHINNTNGHFDLWGREDVNGVFDAIDGKFTIGNDRYSKPDSEDPEAEPYSLSDMYRVLAQCKVCLSKAQADLQTIFAIIGGTPTLTIADVMEFKLRYDALFSPMDGKDASDEES